MTDYKSRIATHASNDDWRHFEFVRDTKLPHGTFGKRRSVDGVVFAACMILLAIGLFVVNLP